MAIWVPFHPLPPSSFLHRIQQQISSKKRETDVIKSQQLAARPIEIVVVHQLLLLSIIDNYYRVAKDTRKRVVGFLLGSLFEGVEHLLRDVKDTTISTLATEVTRKLAALKGLDARLKEIRGYLEMESFH